jgi:photosystem II stability/assembly factor-like uncharacterized protein
MASRRVIGCGLLLAGLLAGTAIAAVPGRVALAPNAIAFRDARHGVMGTGWLGCESSAFGCKLQGTISRTSDGGKTWKVALRSPRPVVSVTVDGTTAWARYDDGENLRSNDAGRTWHPAIGPNPLSTPCSPGDSVNAAVTTPGGRAWALCVGQAAAGNASKSVYRLAGSGWKQISHTEIGRKAAKGAIPSAGYPLGMSIADDGFGLIWESRGTLYVTRDGGYHWTAEPHVARPEADFGVSGSVLKGGVGYLVLSQGGRMTRRLLVTHDAGRHWRVTHRWR